MFCGKEEECQREPIIEGVVRALLCTGERIQLYQLEMSCGTVVPEHSHPNEQAGYIIRGRFEAVIGEESEVLVSGSYFRIPVNVPHSGYVHEDTILIDIYSPPR